MAMVNVLVVCLAVVTTLGVTGQAVGQERFTCTGKGAVAPDWFERPPAVPRGTYQAEARSGGCPDAETAQKVAARTVAWRLSHLMSAPVLVEELQTVRRTLDGRTYESQEEQVELVQRALAGRILESGWAVHRQETRWTRDGLSEHFVIVRADSASMRQLAAEELERYLGDVRAAGRGVVDLETPSDAGSRWVDVRQRVSHRKAATYARGGEPPRGLARVDDRRRGGPIVRRLVLSGAVYFAKATRPEDLAISRASASVDLLPSDAGAALVAAATYERDDGWSLGVPERDVALGPGRSEALHTLVLVAVRGWPPLYAGYRHSRREELGLDGRARGVRREPGFVLGLGAPPFTEWYRGVVQNAYVDVMLAQGTPGLRQIRAGVRGEVAATRGLALRALLLGEAELTSLGAAADLLDRYDHLVSQALAAQVLAGAVSVEAGLEVVLGRAVSIKLSGVYGVHRLLVGSGADLFTYERISEGDQFGLIYGLRLAL